MLDGALVLAPFVWIGLKIGNRIHVGLTQEQMRRVVGAIVVVHRHAAPLQGLSIAR